MDDDKYSTFQFRIVDNIRFSKNEDFSKFQI